MGILSVENVTKSYGDFVALNSMTLDVPKGSIFGLLGPNGAGKTTFIRVLNQIIEPDCGNITLDGQKLERKHIKDIGYMPEERGLYPNMTVEEQVIYLGMLKGLSKQQAKEGLEFWLERFEVPEWRGKKLQELSKGMAQKVQFIVTVIHNPKILIFDEVFSGLDPVNAEIIRDQILYMREKGASIIFSTHRMESVEDLCDYIAIINKSKKVLDGSVMEVKNKFRTNIFEVGVIPKLSKQEFLDDMKLRFKISPANFKSLFEDVKINVCDVDVNSSSDLLSYLASRGQLTHFREVVPSINDIFVQLVKNTENGK